MPVLGDSGCSGSCISYDYFVNNPFLKQRFVPKDGRGTAINGSDVLSVGEVRLEFSLANTPMAINCRVIKGLMDPIVLGWDWMFKYGVKMDPANGMVLFGNGLDAPLIEHNLPHLGAYYKAFEDIVLPPHSKVHTDVEFVTGEGPLVRASASVVTDPFELTNGTYYAASTCSRMRGNRFMTELMNTSSRSVRIHAGEIIGFARLVDDKEFEAEAVHSNMSCSFGVDKPHAPDPTPTPSHTPQPPTPPDESREAPSERFYAQEEKSEIPPGAKPLKVDLSKIAEDARPYEAELRDLLTNKRKKAFSKHDRDYGRTTLIQYRAHMKDPDQNPISHPPYRTRPEMREIIDEQAHQMIADGLVGPSKSPYSAPIMLSKKKCGGWRFLTDFRKVNACCTKVVYPLPRIEDSIQRLENPKFFSSMDLTKGFWQIPIHPDDRKFFAFSTENLHLEYLVAPMGAKNSPSYLSSLMQLVLRGLPIQHVISYLDDILVADTCMEDHLRHLDLVLSALEKAGLKLNPAKCAFARDSVVCLGHRLSRDGVSPDPANIEKIKSWKTPDSAKKLRTFLGLTGYYRQYVQGYSEIASCLTDLTRDDAKWIWTDQHQKAFEQLREDLMSEKVMSYPNFSLPFVVKTDASLTAIGFVLVQKVEGKERVIAYGSKKLSQQQQRWSTYDREFFALIAAVRANAHYLRHARFTAITDHRPLLAWRKVDARKDPTGRRTRWVIELENYEFDLIYKQGKIHCDADAMSRRGDDDDEIAEDEDEFLGLRFLESWEQDPEQFFFFMGMEEENEHSMVKFQAEEESMDRLRQMQDEDAIVAEVKNFVRMRRRLPHKFPCPWYRRNSKWLVIREGILYRRAYAQVVHADILQAVIPDSMIDEVLEDLHGSQWAGHPSAGKMLLQVRRFAVWPTLPSDIKRKVADCKVCDQLREQVPKPQTPLHPIVATRVFDHVMCDLVSFPPSNGFKYVLVFKDVFSGFIKCYKLRDKTTKGVTRCFEDLVCSLGPPMLLTSDNGGEFISDMLKEACRLVGVEKRTSVPYRPQSQGNVERQNRTLIQGLQQRLLDFGKSWSDHLPYVEWHYNVTPHARTQMSPYFIFFGREPYLPRFTEQPGAGDPKEEKFAKDMKEKLQLVYDEANRRAERMREREAEQYNRREKHTPFSPGDQVWEHVEVRNKLEPKWSGPIRVRSRSPSPSGRPGSTYVCDRPDGTSCRKNYEQLKRVNAKFNEDMLKPVEDPKPKTRSLASLLAIVCSTSRDRELPEATPPASPHAAIVPEPGPLAVVPPPVPPPEPSAEAHPAPSVVPLPTPPVEPAPAPPATPPVEPAPAPSATPFPVPLRLSHPAPSTTTPPSAAPSSMPTLAPRLPRPPPAPETEAMPPRKEAPPVPEGTATLPRDIHSSFDTSPSEQEEDDVTLAPSRSITPTGNAGSSTGRDASGATITPQNRRTGEVDTSSGKTPLANVSGVSNLDYESDSELDRAICESNTKTRPEDHVRELLYPLPSTSRGVATMTSSGRRATPEGNVSADDSHEYSTPSGNPTVQPQPSRLGHQVFKNVRRRIHMPPDVIVHEAEPVAQNVTTGEVAQGRSPHPMEAQITGLIPSPVPSAYLVPTSTGQIPVERVPIPTASQEALAGPSGQYQSNRLAPPTHQALPVHSPEQRAQTGKVRYRDLRPRVNTIYDKTNKPASDSESDNETGPHAGDARANQKFAREQPPRGANGRFIRKK